MKTIKLFLIYSRTNNEIYECTMDEYMAQDLLSDLISNNEVAEIIEREMEISID